MTGHSHNVGLVNGCHTLAIVVTGILKCKLCNSARCILRNKLDTLYNTIHDLHVHISCSWLTVLLSV